MCHKVFVRLGTPASSLDQKLYEGRDLFECLAPRSHSDTSNVQWTWRQCSAGHENSGAGRREVGTVRYRPLTDGHGPGSSLGSGVRLPENETMVSLMASVLQCTFKNSSLILKVVLTQEKWKGIK